MNWQRLLSPTRLSKSDPEPLLAYRSPFEIDTDRVTFSSAFRRLGDKMQVHGLTGTDNVRNRLTHSIECSRVGRSLGAIVGRDVVKRANLSDLVSPADVGHVVMTAALTHDIGSMPFGHVGEDIISDWFVRSPLARDLLSGMPPECRADFETCEGNAQGFRLLAAVEGKGERGGLQMTCATLGAFTKYPWGSGERSAKGKYGFYGSEKALFREVAEATGLLPGATPGTWCRHPLAFLVEAADDICYSVVDLEDALRMRCLSFAEIEELLAPIARASTDDYRDLPQRRKLLHLRSDAIENLICACAEAFLDFHDEIMGGTFAGDLLSQTPYASAMQRIAAISAERIYHSGERDSLCLTAHSSLTTILDGWFSAFSEWEARVGLSPRSESLLRMFPDGAARVPVDRYGWMRVVMDYIAGMTDGYAVAQAARMGV